MQTGAGLLGNFFLLCHCASTFLSRSRMRPKDSIYFHLALANSIMLISKGVPQTLFGLEPKNFLNHIECRLITFLHRVGHSLSLNNTCLLSGFQIITLNPFTCSLLSELKTHASIYIFPICLCSWIFHILLNSYILVNLKTIIISNNTRIWNLGFCFHYASTSFTETLFIAVYSVTDFLCVGFMVIVNGYLVLFLHRHHQQVQHLHSSSQLSRKSSEIRATYTILVLVSTYISFYSVNSILALYLSSFSKHNQWMIPISAFLNACYSAISPFVLINSDSQILHFFYSFWGKRVPQDPLFFGCSTAPNSISIFTKRNLSVAHESRSENNRIQEL
ncbi:vomeronasal type-1 receptor 1-like [Macrotis lagotis]|uniref:vomeronasal type-1 receptor 1-like n=1 Tax=Macrotis lagotis TaxID=92651 RepID=UPI003D69B345